MHAETPSRTTALEWAGALLLAAMLHAALVTGLPRATTRIGAAGDGRPAGETRIRLSLGAAARPADRGVGGPASPAPAAVPARPRSHPPGKAAHPSAPGIPARPSPATPVPSAPAPSTAPLAPAVAVPAGVDVAAAGASEPGGAEGGSRAPEAGAGGPGAVAASGAPGGSPGTNGSGAAADLRARYFDAVHQQVVASLDYPRRARLEQIEGSVVLALRIDRSGRLEECEVAQSSGSLLLDRHALRIVRRAAPFGPVPASFDEADLAFEQPVDFRLRD